MKPLSRTFWASSLALSLVAAVLVFGSYGFATITSTPSPVLSVVPGVFDPFDTDLIAALWIDGTGCPTGAHENFYYSPVLFTDPACPTGDPKDGENEGLLLVKTGQTPNYASATATIKGIPKNTLLTEIGYDIRSGSHCGAGAPRFNITTTTGLYYDYLGCNSPAPFSSTPSSLGWRRLRWGNGTVGSVSAYLNGVTLQPITDPIKSISIVFDEAQDASGGPDSSGMAVLDNIDVNGKLVGRAPNQTHHDHDDHH